MLITNVELKDGLSAEFQAVDTVEVRDDAMLKEVSVQGKIYCTIATFLQILTYNLITVKGDKNILNTLERFESLNYSNVDGKIANRMDKLYSELKCSIIREDNALLLNSTPLGTVINFAFICTYLDLFKIHTIHKFMRNSEWDTFYRWIESLPKFYNYLN